MGICCAKQHTVEYASTIKFIPPIEKAHVIKVYDGDTFTIAAKLPWNRQQFYRFSVRIKGIDCPEMKTSNKNEKKVALLAQQFVSNLILQKIIQLKDITYDKYGRLCAHAFIGETNIGDALLSKHLAIPYNGGTKKPPKNWMKYYNLR